MIPPDQVTMAEIVVDPDPAWQAVLGRMIERSKAILDERARLRRRHWFLRILGRCGFIDFETWVRVRAYEKVMP